MPQRTVASPIGPIRLHSEGGRLTAVRIDALPEADVPGDTALLDRAAAQLGEYFAGERSRFDLPLAPASTARGAALRDAIAGIEAGEVTSYGALAERAGSGARAIGQACARNPLPIIVPCHRVVAADGLGHFSGGDGVATKRWLLAHEGVVDRVAQAGLFPDQSPPRSA